MSLPPLTASSPFDEACCIKNVLAVLLVFLSCMPGVSEEPSALERLENHNETMHDRLRPTVVSILCEVKDEENPKQGQYYGTGVITTENGYVLSNTSVVPPGAENIRVILHNRQEKSAELVGASMRFEVSLLKMEGGGYQNVDVGNSRELNLGDQIYSAGNAFGLAHQQGHISFSSGIVSGIYRTESVYWQSQYRGLQLEVDSSINPGTDGGPILNLDGKLVGIISLTADRARWMGMAVPTHLFQSYTRLLRSYDTGEQNITGGSPYLGVQLANFSNDNKEEPTGIRVKDVTEKSPAWFAGLRRGDIIYMADGTDLTGLNDFDRVMSDKSEGDQFLIFIERGSQRWSLLLRVGSKPI